MTVPTDRPINWDSRSNRTIAVEPTATGIIDVGIWGHHFVMDQDEASDLCIKLTHAIREARR